jgi:hypothetical protein
MTFLGDTHAGAGLVTKSSTLLCFRHLGFGFIGVLPPSLATAHPRPYFRVSKCFPDRHAGLGFGFPGTNPPLLRCTHSGSGFRCGFPTPVSGTNFSSGFWGMASSFVSTAYFILGFLGHDLAGAIFGLWADIVAVASRERLVKPVLFPVNPAGLVSVFYYLEHESVGTVFIPGALKIPISVPSSG